MPLPPSQAVNCPDGQSVVRGTTRCENYNTIEFWSWCQSAGGFKQASRDYGQVCAIFSHPHANQSLCSPFNFAFTQSRGNPLRLHVHCHRGSVTTCSSSAPYSPEFHMCLSAGSACGDFSAYNSGVGACDCQGMATRVSGSRGDAKCECSVSGANSACACPAGTNFISGENRCSCPAGKTAISEDGGEPTCYDNADAQAKADCEARGWTTSLGPYTGLSEQRGLYCNIPAPKDGQVAASERCAIVSHPTGETAPSCSSVFGAQPVFPEPAVHSVPGAPILTKPVSADWEDEDFTLYWRPPATGNVANIIGYRIYREQNGSGSFPTHHPADPAACEDNAFSMSLENSAFTVTVRRNFYEHTVNPSNNAGVTHGNCYRWKIAAVSDDGSGPSVGPAVATDPILSRGYTTGSGAAKRAHGYDNTRDDAGTACPAGQFRPYAYANNNKGDWDNVCVPGDHIGRAELCNFVGRRFDATAVSYQSNSGLCAIDTFAWSTWCEDELGYVTSSNTFLKAYCVMPDDDCGTLSEYNIDHRECHCQNWAEPAAAANADSPNICECNVPGANANCECPANNPYVPSEHRCGCPAGEAYNAATALCESPETVALLAEIVKASPSLSSVVALLDAGANPNAITNTVPALLTAAALGHADVVSVLITAGADPDARNPVFHRTNVAHFMAAPDGNDLTRAQKLDVLRHFAGGLAAATATLDWNGEDGNNSRPMALLRTSHGMESGGRDIIAEMADLMLAHGGRCPGVGGQIYHDACVGTLGRALEELVNQNRSVTLASAADVAAAAQAMVDAGISPEVAGSPMGGHLVPLAAYWGQEFALSVMLTFGMDPHGGDTGGRTALNYIAQNSNSDAVMLDVLRAFIGGLDASGKLTGDGAYDGWNATTHGSGTRTPLEIFQNIYGTATDSDDLRERQALFYENGSRCASPGTKKYCQIPTEDIAETARIVGEVLTVSRPRLSIRPLVPSVETNLTMNGWTVTVDTIDASTARLILSRTRVSRTDAAAVFTLTMLRGSDAVRIVNVSIGFEGDPAYVSLVAAVTLGDHALAATLVNANLIDVFADGVPLLITAALLGRAKVVSVLLTAGYDPAVKWGGFQVDQSVPFLMADDQVGLAADKRPDVLRHFGEAIKVRGTLFDWNAPIRSGGNDIHISQWMNLVASFTSRTDLVAVFLGMTDYMLAQGMSCGHFSSIGAKYGDYCVGTLGRALSDLVNQNNNVTLVSAADVAAAARAMVDAGITLEAAGDPVDGHLIPNAAFWGQPHALSVLLALGMDADGEDQDGNTALVYVASGGDAAEELEILRAFIGGLDASGRLTGDDAYDGWNNLVLLGDRLLDDFHTSNVSRSDSEERDEMHALFYDYGARCDSPGAKKYCQVPTQDIARTVRTTGNVLTVSRRPLGFRSLSAGVSSSLSANGWATEVLENASPQEFIVSRTRQQPTGGGDAAAVFALTMTNAAASDADSRIVMISLVAAPNPDYASLVSSVLEGDVGETRRFLATLGAGALGAETSESPPVPLVIAAAVRGHSDVLSVLVTFGMDVNARHPDSQTYFNHAVPFLMADIQNGVALSRAERLDVVRHFGDAAKVRGTLFNWNAADGSGYRLPNLLQFSEDETTDAAEHSVLLETADYLLGRGMNCDHASDAASRYQKYCVGKLGAVLVSLITMTVAIADDDVRAAAQAMVEAGITLEAAGDAMNGHLVPVAAHNRHANAVSILITFGMDPTGERRGTDAVPHVVALQSGGRPAAMLNVLRAFIGGLSVAGKLQGFDWSVRSISDSALDLLDDVSLGPADEPPEKDEIHSLIYELGGRCRSKAGFSDVYCDIPTENFALPPVSGSGAFFTLTARAFSDFQSPPVDAEVAASLQAGGWGYALNTAATPDELELNRIRLALPSDAPAVFTVTLIGAGEASRELRVWATVMQGEIPQEYGELVTAVLEGDAEEIRGLLGDNANLINSNDEEGVPLLIVAATLGHSEIVSVLIEAGFNPAAPGGGSGRTSWTALHHIADSVRGDATVALESLRSFVGGLRVAGKLESFEGWNVSAGSDGHALDVFHAAAISDSDSQGEKDEMHQLFFLYGAACAAAGDRRYCALPREDYEFLNIARTGPVVTLSGLGAEGEHFALPDGARTAELHELGWLLESDAGAAPPVVVLVRDAVGRDGEAAVTVGLTLRLAERDLRAYRVVARVTGEFEDCAASNQQEVAGNCATDGGLPVCLEDSVLIGGGVAVDADGASIDDCVRKNGDFRRTPQRRVCLDYLDGEVVDVVDDAGNVVSADGACRGIDTAGTFCILDATGSDPAFPCRGLFRHILLCNLTYNRPGENPFVCGESCGESGTARGADCE